MIPSVTIFQQRCFMNIPFVVKTNATNATSISEEKLCFHDGKGESASKSALARWSRAFQVQLPPGLRLDERDDCLLR